MTRAEIPSNVLVILPARNEENTIGQIITEIRKLTRNVLVVDDNSKDETPSLARSRGAVVIGTAERPGYGSALIAGLRYALEHGFSTVVTLDADGAHDPSQIPELYYVHERSGCCLTIGSRFGSGKMFDIPSSKRWVNVFASHLINRALGTTLEDVACGFRVLSSSLVRRLLEKATSCGFGVVCEILKTAIEANCRICSAPVNVRYDATDILCTNRQELLDALTVLSRQCHSDPSLAGVVAQLASAVAEFQPVTILLPHTILCAHPITGAGAYLFQAQHRYFAARTLGKTFDFR